MPQKVIEQLWIGDVTDAIDIERLKKLGISAVCCLAPDTAYWTDPVDYRDFSRRVFAFQDGEPMPRWLLDETLTWISEKIEDKQEVLVHCAAGISRSASVCIAHLMAEHGWTWDKGLDHLRQIRPVVMPHPELKRSVLQFFSVWPYDGSLGEPEGEIPA